MAEKALTCQVKSKGQRNERNIKVNEAADEQGSGAELSNENLALIMFYFIEMVISLHYDRCVLRVGPLFLDGITTLIKVRTDVAKT